MIKHKGGCHCGEITFSTSYDPMLKSLCNCSRCRKIFGTVNAHVIYSESEVEVSGEAKKYTCMGGSGMQPHSRIPFPNLPNRRHMITVHVCNKQIPQRQFLFFDKTKNVILKTPHNDKKDKHVFAA